MRTKNLWGSVLPVCLALVVSGCGGGGSSSESVPESVLAGLPVQSSQRISTISFEFSDDASVDRQISYLYDDSGRVSRIVDTEPNDPSSVARVTEYEYSADGVTRVNIERADFSTTISYEAGLVSDISDSDGEQQTYSYDNNQRLVVAVENERLCDDFELLAIGLSTSEFDYEDGLLSSITTTDDLGNTLLIRANYNAQDQPVQLIRTESCVDDDLLINEIEELSFSYDDAGTPSGIQSNSFINDTILISSESTSITRDDQGRVIEIVERDDLDNTIDETRTISYGLNGLPSIEVVEFNNPSLFVVRPATTITYTYEEASCVLSYAISPERLAVVSSLLAASPRFLETEALLCGYPFD